jgi:TonB-dependent receptor
MSFGNQVPLFGKPFGVIVSSTYGREFSGYEDGRSAQYEATDPDANELNTTFDFSDLNSQEKANWGLMANLAYRPHAHHEIAFNGLRTQEGEQLGRYQVGIYPKNSLPPVQYETYVLQYTERSAQSFQLRGEHYFSSLAGLRADWNASLTSTTQSEPDLRFFFDQFVQIDFNQDGIGDTTVYDINLGSSNATPPSRVFRDMDEMNEEGSVNFTLPIRVNNANKFTVKFGGTYLNKDRDFKERKYNYRDNALDFSDFGGNIFSFFTNENVGIIAESNGRYTFGNTIEDGSRKANNYDGLQRIYAGYGMVEMPLFRNLRFVGGVRYESTDMRIVSEDSTKSIGRIEEQDILPSANLIYALTENANLRISATRTLARPTFREIAPFTSFSFAGGPELSGNPELRRTLISNYDVRVEWFLQPGEVMAISAFYKYFQDPIERVFISNNNQVTFVNVPTAEVRGAEFEMRLGMGRFTPLLNHLWITSNLALIESEVQVPQRELELAAGFDIDTHRPFQGQSPYVLNIGLSYERPSLSNLHLSATYNKFGERLSSVALGGAPNIFEQPRDDLYVSAGIRILKMFDIKFSVDNLLDSDYLESQEYKEREFVTRRYVTGRTFKLSFSYGF